MWKLSVGEVMSLLGGKLLSGNADAEINGFASLKEAARGDLSFFSDRRYDARLRATHASAVLVPADWTECPANVACIGVSDPSRAFETIVETYGVQPQPFVPGVHPSAVIAPSARLDRMKTCVGPNAVIDEGVTLEDGVEIAAGCYVGRDVRIGAGTKLSANCTVHTGCTLGKRVILHSGVVVGADGFGYEFDAGRHRKVRQSGIVQIDDDVEVGAGTTIDRARFGRTWIGEGTKIDNLVQIGHNVVIGRHCIIVACTAIAGSAVVGDYVVIAAQVGIAGHVSVGSQSRLGGRSGVTKDLPPGQSYLGFPAVLATEERRRIVSTRNIPEMQRRLKALEARLDAIDPKSPEKGSPG